MQWLLLHSECRPSEHGEVSGALQLDVGLAEWPTCR